MLAVAAIATGLAWAILPGASAHYFGHEIFHPARFGGLDYAGNQSWSGIFHRWPFDGAGAWIAVGMALSVVTLVVVGTLAARLAPTQPLPAGLAVAMGGLLISPISWTHHWCWLVLAPLVMWQLRASRSLVVLWGLVAIDAMVAPYWIFRRGTSGLLAGASLVVLAFVTLLWWLRVELAAAPTVDSAAPAVDSAAVHPIVDSAAVHPVVDAAAMHPIV